MKFGPHHTFTRLDARITEEEGEFTVSVRLKDHLKENENVWGVEKASSIEVASEMIGAFLEADVDADERAAIARLEPSETAPTA